MDEGQGFADGDVRKWCEKVSGTSFERFFKDYVDGTEELPFTKVLRKIGLIAKPRKRKVTKDKDNKKQSRRRRPPTWQVTLAKNATRRALRLRKDMTKRTAD